MDLYEVSSGGNTKRFISYFLAVSALFIAATFFLSSPNTPHKHLLSHSIRVWPELKFSWRSVLATIIGFTGSAFGTVGGVGGGGIFVPMLNLIVGFDTKSAAALSKCMIMGASLSSVWYNLRVSHPTKEVPIIDYDLALLFQPMLMLGITIGVELSVVFPYWLITVLIIILFLGNQSNYSKSSIIFIVTTTEKCPTVMNITNLQSIQIQEFGMICRSLIYIPYLIIFPLNTSCEIKSDASSTTTQLCNYITR